MTMMRTDGMRLNNNFRKLAKHRKKQSEKNKIYSMVDYEVVNISEILDKYDLNTAIKIVNIIIDMADKLMPNRNTYVIPDEYCKHLGWTPKKRQ